MFSYNLAKENKDQDLNSSSDLWDSDALKKGAKSTIY